MRCAMSSFVCLGSSTWRDWCDKPCRYYINKTKKPKNRASVRLAVKIGSIVEEEAERGVAHIVEHLAFSATSVRACRNSLTNLLFFAVPTVSDVPCSAKRWS